jgi:hypothetical protein
VAVEAVLVLLGVMQFLHQVVLVGMVRQALLLGHLFIMLVAALGVIIVARQAPVV